MTTRYSAHPAAQVIENHDPLLYLEPAGRYAGCGARQLRRLVHQGRIEHVRIGGRIMFRTSTLDALIARSTVPATGGGAA